MIVDGWPDRQRDLHPQRRPFWPYRDELVVDDGTVLKGNHCIYVVSFKYIGIIYTNVDEMCLIRVGSMAFVTVFVSSDGSTVRLFTAVGSLRPAVVM